MSTAFDRFLSRATAFVFALAVTAATLGAIDALAHRDAASQLAQASSARG